MPFRESTRAHAQSGGQALVEFAMTIGIFLLVLLGAVAASLYTVERAAAVTAVAAGARVAVGGSSQAGGENAPDLGDAGYAVQRVAGRLLFGTQVDVLTGGRPCDGLDQVPHGQVQVCSTQNGDQVTVRLRGWPGGLGPEVGWPLDVSAEVHTLTFSR
jgi:hypothetical protein